MTRILWINPVGTDSYDAPIGAWELSWIPVAGSIPHVDPR